MDSSDEELFEFYEHFITSFRPRIFRERTELLFFYNEKEFLMRYRLSKDSCSSLLALLPNVKSSTMRNKPVSAMNKLLLTLRFYATGTFQIVIGDLVGIDRSTVSRIVKQVSYHIAALAPEKICFPATQRELLKLKQLFNNIARFPGVIGAIDCTHIPIISPGGNDSEIYRNRKGWFSINVQAVCDAQCKFLNVVARWPGSVHDSTIFLNSRLRAQLQNNEFGDGILLGDSGYACSPRLFTPLSQPSTQAEILYNKAHIHSRNVIERAFGILKRRFPCLSVGLRLKLQTSLICIVSCFVLHNILIGRNEIFPAEEIHIPPNRFPRVETSPVQSNTAATSARTHIINTVFRERVRN